MRYMPLATKVLLDNSLIPVRGLIDLDSNTCLIDKQLFKDNYPNAKIYPSTFQINGIGKNNIEGFTMIPITFPYLRAPDKTSG